MAKVMLPASLRHFAGGQSTLEIQGENVKSLLMNLNAKYSEIGRRILNEESRLNNFVHIFVDEKDIRLSGGLETQITDKSQIIIMTAIAGG